MLFVFTGLLMPSCSGKEEVRPLLPVRTVETDSFIVTTPGPGWNVVEDRQAGVVLFEHARQSAEDVLPHTQILIRRLQIDEQIDGPTEEEIAARVWQRELRAARTGVPSGLGVIENVKKEIVILGEQRHHAMRFTLGDLNAVKDIAGLHYLSFPRDFRTSRRIYHFGVMELHPRMSGATAGSEMLHLVIGSFRPKY